MNQRAEQALLEKLKQLSPERFAEVEDFVEFLATKERRQRAGQELRAMWTRMPAEEITPEIEQEIVTEVRGVRAARRNRGAK